MNNVIIIGSGPAGCCAGLYCARANLQPLMIEGSMEHGLFPGGQLTTTTIVENYLGVDSAEGFALTQNFRKHAEKYGLKSHEATVTSVTQTNNNQSFQVTLADGCVFNTKAIIIATGATAKRLHLPSEEIFWEHGISACAVCDGALPMFRGKPLAVVGGGDTAMEEALFLTKFASVVYVIHRRDEFRASKIMTDRLLSHPKVKVVYDTVVDDAGGTIGDDSTQLTHLKLHNVKTGFRSTLPVSGLFYAIGHTPNTGFLRNLPLLKLDKDGYIVTEAGSTRTSVDGIFACGDVQDKKYRQAITAAGSGCMAALDLEHWMNHASMSSSSSPSSS